ncbi:MAG: NTP transferase domain-containing protein [Sandaracinaceae bacterium]|jgi:1L-myo-inositol 1-phosphate cytidylyltransferase|nr:NTP transferase domain-containing protein [Sandaracinaceae bacterium]
MKAIILAAGRGERLVSGLAYPKPLKRVGGVPLIVRILRNLERAGVDEVGIIVGYLGDVLTAALRRYPFKMKLTFIENDEWHKPNGTSLLKARDFVTEATFVLMSDHLWSPELLTAVARYPLDEDEAVLGIDFDVPRCFDLPDATKVFIDGDRVVNIGKQLETFHALDTGVFRITPALMDELARVNGPDGCSLSQGVAALAARGQMRVVDVGDAMWIDVDTPATHAFAERQLSMYGDALRELPDAAVAATG